jgi:hypothetical protein
MSPHDKSAYLDRHRQHYLDVRELPDGEHWTGVELMACNARIVTARIDDVFGIEASWQFETAAAAFRSLAAWSGLAGTEPDGWIRASRYCKPFRRRPNGDPAFEYLDHGD